MECLMCHTYVHDVLRNPVSLAGTNPKRAMQYTHLFVPEFVRAGHKNTTTEFVSLLFVETGGIKRTCHIRDPMVVARTWVRLQQKAIGDLGLIHFQHTNVRPTAEHGLRIRIPPNRDYDDLYT
jgi:hypothetical protein